LNICVSQGKSTTVSLLAENKGISVTGGGPVGTVWRGGKLGAEMVGGKKKKRGVQKFFQRKSRGRYVAVN